MTSNPADCQTPGGSVNQSLKDSTLVPPPGFPTIQETPVPAEQTTITMDNRIDAFKADVRMEMEALRRDIQDMVSEKGKQVVEDSGNNNPEATLLNGNSGSQQPENPKQKAPSTQPQATHLAATS